MARRKGYERRKLELAATERYRDGEFDKQVYRQLMNDLAAGNNDKVHKALYNENYKYRGGNPEKTKPDPLNLSWEEIVELEEVLDEELMESTDTSTERYKKLERIYSKTQKAKQ